MRLKRMAGGLLMVAFGMAIWGCPKEQKEPSVGNPPPKEATGKIGGPGGGTGGKKLTIAVIPKGTQHQFWQAVHAGAEAAGKEAGAEIIWQGPNPEGDNAGQINLVQTQVTNKVDGIVLAATDATALVTPVKEAIAKGVPVVTIDSGIKEDIAACYIATDNVKGGEAAADALAKAIGEKGKVGLLIFGKGSVSSDEREAGFKKGIAKYPNIQLISTLENNTPTGALDNMTNMMTANPDIVGIFAANEPNGTGAGNFVNQNKKLEGKLKIVAYDTSDDEIRHLEEGRIQALIVQDPFKMGYLGVQTVIKAIKKEAIPSKKVDSGFVVVTKDNLKTPEVQKLLHPAP